MATKVHRPCRMIFAIATTFASLDVNGAATEASPNLIVGGSLSSSSINEPSILSDNAADNSSGVFLCPASAFGVAFSGTATLVDALLVELSDRIVPFVTPFTVVLPSLLLAIAANA